MEKRKMKIWKKCLIILIIIALVSLGAFISYELYLKISDKIDLDRKYEEFEKIQTVETKETLTYSEDEKISKVGDMDYVMQDGVGAKVESVSLNDNTLLVNFNFKLDEEFDYKTFGYSYAVYDENKNIYYISGRQHLGEKVKYDYGYVFMQRELDMDKIKNPTETFLADSGGLRSETLNEEEKTIRSTLEIGAEDKFPLSQKLYIKIFDLGYFNVSQDENGKPIASNTNLTNAKWLFELDIPEEMNKRDTINLKLAEEIPGLTIKEISLTDTKLVLRYESKDYRELISAGKDMPAGEFTAKTKEMLSVTDGEGNEYKELSGGTRGENEYKMVLEANKNDLDKKLYINYKIGDEQYKSELIKDE